MLSMLRVKGEDNGQYINLPPIPIYNIPGRERGHVNYTGTQNFVTMLFNLLDKTLGTFNKSLFGCTKKAVSYFSTNNFVYHN